MAEKDMPSREPEPPDRGLSRRRLLGAAGLGTGAALLGIDPTAAFGADEPDTKRPETPDEALVALLKGNERYATNQEELRDYSHLGEKIASKQIPFAAVLSCADSRVSPTLVFDLGHGNLFNVRVAGNVSGPVATGSLEYAVEHLEVPLVVVLGHSDCGGVKAALSVVTQGKKFPKSKYGSIGAFVDKIVPTIRRLPKSRRTLDRAIEANARAQARSLAKREPILAERVKDGRLKVVAATYDIASGRVTFLS